MKSQNPPVVLNANKAKKHDPDLMRMFPHCQSLLNAVRVFAVLGFPAEPLMLAIALEDPQVRELVEKRLQESVKRFQERKMLRKKNQAQSRDEARGDGPPIKKTRRSTPLRALVEGLRSRVRR
jgi:hypothetical protein